MLLRNVIVYGLTSFAVAGLLGLLAQWLFRNDIKGLRTAWTKRSPATFAHQDLTGRSFEKAFLPYANFRQTKLYETILSDANVQYADFSAADFEMAGLSETNFSHAIFHDAKLQQARWLDSAIFRHASFRKTDLSWVSFHGLYGSHRRSKKQHMMDPGYGGADMAGAVFDEADCRHTILSRCILVGASFKGADCREASFHDADLRNADFTNADLRGAKFDGADLTGAIFVNTKR